jgi:hypothetical protein
MALLFLHVIDGVDPTENTALLLFMGHCLAMDVPSGSPILVLSKLVAILLRAWSNI